MDTPPDNKKQNVEKVFGFVGVNFVTKHLLNSLAETYIVIAWNRTKTDEPFSSKIKLIICEASWMQMHHWFVKKGLQLSLPFYFKGLMPSLWREKPDVLIVMDYFRFTFIQALLYALFHPKVKLTIHTETKRPPQSLPAKTLFYIMSAIVWMFQWRIHHIITYSQKGTMYLSKLFPFTAVSHLAIPIEEDTPYYTDVTPGNTIRLLLPARFVEFKRHSDVIAAMELVPIDQKINIDFASFEPNTDSLLQSVKSNLAQSSAKSRIKIIEPIKKPFLNYYRVLANYDGIILPSENEGLGAVVPAALRCGRIAITSDTVGANIYMDDVLQKYQFITRDTQALSRLLSTLSKEQIKHDNTYAAKRMRQVYDANSITHRFLEKIQ